MSSYIDSYIQREKETIARLRSVEGEVNTHFLTRQFLVAYDKKHSGNEVDINDPVAYMSRRAEVFDRYVSRHLLNARREAIVRSPTYNGGQQ